MFDSLWQSLKVCKPSLETEGHQVLLIFFSVWQQQQQQQQQWWQLFTSVGLQWGQRYFETLNSLISAAVQNIFRHHTTFRNIENCLLYLCFYKFIFELLQSIYDSMCLYLWFYVFVFVRIRCWYSRREQNKSEHASQYIPGQFVKSRLPLKFQWISLNCRSRGNIKKRLGGSYSE